MKQRKVDFSKDIKQYHQVGELLEQRLLFLLMDYQFYLEKKLDSHSVVIFFKRPDLSIMLCYGAPEFEVTIGILFEENKQYYNLGKLLGSNLFHWDWEWVPKTIPYDKVMSGINTAEIFLKKELDFIIQHKDLFI